MAFPGMNTLVRVVVAEAGKKLLDFLETFDVDADGQKDFKQARKYIDNMVEGSGEVVEGVNAGKVIEKLAEAWDASDKEKIKHGTEKVTENAKALHTLVSKIVEKYTPRDDASPTLLAMAHGYKQELVEKRRNGGNPKYA